MGLAYLPGIVATLALVMINAIRRYVPPCEDLTDGLEWHVEYYINTPDHT